MPELPEVETTRRGIAPHLVGMTITGVSIRAVKLRHTLAPSLASDLAGQKVRGVERRGKYLLIRCQDGTLLVHLGMTGHLRLVPAHTAPGKYDHFEIGLNSGRLLRLTDPRKFGTVLWTTDDPLSHPLLADLGPEPLDDGFTGEYLFARSRRRSVAVKPFLMDSRVVVGLGNIYANEALFRAGIRPETPAGSLLEGTCERLAAAVKGVLTAALELGGTTLQDFVSERVKPGYFRLKLAVYERGGEPCVTCGTPINVIRLGGRSTYFCPVCQK